MMKNAEKFTHDLLVWYKKFGRKLPWRETTDPYKIWISEIMLQQTQVSRVMQDFYPKFLKKFPDVYTLANSSWEEVYPVWKGLGYYSRGKNLLASAKIIAEGFEGEFPREKKLLETLPGIGTYTASALLSFAFDECIPAIDTNIEKIIRILWPQEDIVSYAKKLISFASSPRDWNNAMMDLSTLLREGNEISGDLGKFFPEEIAHKFLPVRKKSSRIRIQNIKDSYPKNRGKRKFRLEVGIACIHRDGKYLIQARPEGKTFVGFWEFPGGKREKGETLRDCVKREIQEELGIEISVRPHFFEEMHQFETTELLLRFHRCQIQKGEPRPLENQKIDWVRPEDFGKINFLKTNAKALKALQKFKT